MSIKKFFNVTIFLVLTVVVLTACGSGQGTIEEEGSPGAEETNESNTASQNEATIKMAYNLPAEHTVGQAMEKWAEEIESRTADTSLKLNVDTFPAGQLFNDSTMVDGVLSGSVEIGEITMGTWTGTLPSLKLAELPFVLESFDHLFAAEDGELGDLIGQEMETQGAKLLSFIPYGSADLYFNDKRVENVEDMQGLRIRAFGGSSADALEAYGAVPTVMSSTEMYQGLERGTIDGVHTGPSSIIDRNLYEVITDGMEAFSIFISFPGIANIEWWDSLPEDTQQAVLEAAQVAQEHGRQLAKEEDINYRNQLVEEGVEIVKLSPEQIEEWVEATQPVYEQYLEENPDIGEQMMEAVDSAK